MYLPRSRVEWFSKISTLNQGWLDDIKHDARPCMFPKHILLDDARLLQNEQSINRKEIDKYKVNLSAYCLVNVANLIHDLGGVLHPTTICPQHKPPHSVQRGAILHRQTRTVRITTTIRVTTIRNYQPFENPMLTQTFRAND